MPSPGSLKRIEHEQEALSGENLDEKIAELQQRLEGIEQEKATREQKRATILSQIRETREQIVATEQKSAEQRRKINEYQGRLSSLEALQQAALGKEDRPVNQWLEKQGLSGRKRFAQQMEVESGWERAVETVLGDTLEAVCVDNIDALSRILGELDKSNGNRDLPVFMAHGSFDPVLPMQWGRASADRLIEAGFRVEWHDYPMAHAVCAEEINDIRTWLLSVFDELRPASKT